MNLDDGLVTHSQLTAEGIPHSEIEARMRAGLLERLRRGVYCIPEELDQTSSHIRLIRATLPFVEPGNVVSHESAAVLHSLPVPSGSLSRISMTRRSTGHGRKSSMLKVRHTAISESEITDIDGIPVTTLARTAADLARTLSYEWGVAVCDAALRKGLSPAALFAGVGRHRRLHGLPQARAIAVVADASSESPAESLSRVQLQRAGVAEPELQYNVVDQNGVVVARTDFGWPELRLVGEVDGTWKYGQLLKPGQTPESAIMREKVREERIRQAGYWIVRWSWEDIHQRGKVPQLVRRAMDLQRRNLGHLWDLPD